VRATLHRRAYTAPGGVRRVVRYYERALRGLKLRWNTTAHAPGAGRVVGRDGTTVARLRIERVAGTHGALVRILVVFGS
jgi:hypothetical protein